MKALIGIDGSAGGYEAARQVSQLLDPARDEAVLYYAPPEIRLAAPAEPAVLQRARDAVATAVFDGARDAMPPELRPRTTTIVGRQSPARGLLLAADETRCDLIAVGARGAGPIEALLLGSVSREVIHAARVPVLVARGRDPRPTDGPRVLVAYDGSEASRHAVDLLRSFHWPATATARLMTVIEPMLVGDLPPWLAAKARTPEVEAFAQGWMREHQSERESREAELLRLLATLPEPLRRGKADVAEGHAGERIIAAIDAERTDLVVMGARGLGAWERLLIGSTAEKVISHGACSVLVVRQREHP